MVCFDYLENEWKNKDEIANHLLNYLENNFDAVFYLLENREKIIKELK